MKIKALLIEFVQATAFALFFAALFASLGGHTNRSFSQILALTFIFGGVITMLAKRFLITLLQELKSDSRLK